MKYSVYEMVLNEYTNSSDLVLVDEIEATSHDSACQIAMQYYPNRGPFRVDNYIGGGNVAIEYTNGN